MNSEESNETELTLSEAVSLVLYETGRPMRYREIAAEIVRRRLVRIRAANPAISVSGAIHKTKEFLGEESPFEFVAPGTYRHRANMEPLRYERTWYDAAVLVLREARTALTLREIAARIAERGLRSVTAPGGAIPSISAAITFRTGREKPILIVKATRSLYILREDLETFRRKERKRREREEAERRAELERRRLAEKKRALVERKARLAYEKQVAPTRIGSKRWREEQLRAIHEEQRGRALRTGENLRWIDAAELVLRDAGRALHVYEIADEIVRRRLRRNPPEHSRVIVASQLSESVRWLGKDSPFVRIAPSVYDLRGRRTPRIVPADRPWREAITIVLREAGGAMCTTDIAEEIVARGLRRELGAFPHRVVSAIICQWIATEGENAAIVRIEHGLYALREHGGAARKKKNG